MNKREKEKEKEQENEKGRIIKRMRKERRGRSNFKIIRTQVLLIQWLETSQRAEVIQIAPLARGTIA